MPVSDPAAGILTVAVSREGNVITLALAGELDLASIDAVREKLAKAQGDTASRIVVDLRKLTFIDSTGIALLLSAVKGDGEGRLSFVSCEAPAVQRVFSVTGVAAVFSEREAVSNGAER